MFNRFVSYSLMLAVFGYTGGALPSIAIVGISQNLKARDYPALCSIRIQNSDGSMSDNDDFSESVCSGTLISPETVITAGHCFGRNYSSYDGAIRVTCGREDRSANSVKLPPDQNWKDDHEPMTNSDYAILTLNSPIKLALPAQYMPITLHPESYFGDNSFIKEGVSCTVFGFGLNNHGSLGSLRSGNLDALRIGIVKNTNGAAAYNTIYTWNLNEALPVSVDHGDSGGSFICQAPNQDPELVGITVSYSLNRSTKKRTENYFTPAWAVPVK